MNNNPRISLNDSLQDIIIKMAEGNPGALTVMLKLFEQEPLIDPDSVWQGAGTIISLDDMGVYGSNIWILYKDVCGESIPNVICLIRARQLGFISESEILGNIATCRLMDLSKIIPQVKERLPKFNMEAKQQ